MTDPPKETSEGFSFVRVCANGRAALLKTKWMGVRIPWPAPRFLRVGSRVGSCRGLQILLHRFESDPAFQFCLYADVMGIGIPASLKTKCLPVRSRSSAPRLLQNAGVAKWQSARFRPLREQSHCEFDSRRPHQILKQGTGDQLGLVRLYRLGSL
jgi:hypothetical protein